MPERRKLLIVSPHFPPVDAVDMHRVRTSLPHYAEFGWDPFVLAVNPDYVERVREPLFLETLPKGLPIHRIRALPLRWTRKMGFSDLGIRALPYIRRGGANIIRDHGIDLVFFSTTMFAAMAAGPGWKRRFGVPYVVDMQDPWVSDYYKGRPKSERPRKYWLSNRIHRILEPGVMKHVDGIIAVSQDYIDTLRGRYAQLNDRPCETLPFGGSEEDFETVRRHPQKHDLFQPGDGNWHGVYAGVVPPNMLPTLRVLFQALGQGLQEDPMVFSKVRLHFLGTSYAADGRARKVVEPLAAELGVLDQVTEQPCRAPYFQALQGLLDADFLIVPGTNDPQYTASKIFPYILAKRPLIAIFHEKSSALPIVRDTHAGITFTFSEDGPSERLAGEILPCWRDLLKSLPCIPGTDWDRFRPYTAREMTRRQCALFDQAVQPNVSPGRS